MMACGKGNQVAPGYEFDSHLYWWLKQFNSAPALIVTGTTVFKIGERGGHLSILGFPRRASAPSSRLYIGV